MITSIGAAEVVVAAGVGAGVAAALGAGGGSFPEASGATVAVFAGAAFPDASEMTPTTVLIWTVLPSVILISESTPAAGEGISASTLSVEISNSGSSCCTVSPGFFNHLVMVPSKIDSPIWGMITSVGMDSLSQQSFTGPGPAPAQTDTNFSFPVSLPAGARSSENSLF